MTTRGSRRAAQHGRGGPGPEIVAAALVVALYTILLVVGLPTFADGGVAEPSDEANAASSPTSPVATPDPLRADVVAILEVDRRLLDIRDELQRLLGNKPFRASEVVTVLRRVSTAVPLGLERATRLSLDPRTQVVGSQLEIIYADAGAKADEALDLAISSNAAYREAAVAIVDLFVDLPTIDVALLAAIGPSSGGSPVPSAEALPSSSPSTEATSAPSLEPSPVASPGASGSPAPTRSPNEMLRNPGFDLGLSPWTLFLRDADDRATTRADLPIVATGTASLRVDISSISSTPDGVRIGQSNLDIEANTRYAVRVVVQSTVERSVRLRVVGPNQEIYGVRVATAGPSASSVEFGFIAIADDPSAGVWIDIAGPLPGTVWLDEASFAPVAPG